MKLMAPRKVAEDEDMGRGVKKQLKWLHQGAMQTTDLRTNIECALSSKRVARNKAICSQLRQRAEKVR